MEFFIQWWSLNIWCAALVSIFNNNNHKNRLSFKYNSRILSFNWHFQFHNVQKPWVLWLFNEYVSARKWKVRIVNNTLAFHSVCHQGIMHRWFWSGHRQDLSKIICLIAHKRLWYLPSYCSFLLSAIASFANATHDTHYTIQNHNHYVSQRTQRRWEKKLICALRIDVMATLNASVQCWTEFRIVLCSLIDFC